MTLSLLEVEKIARWAHATQTDKQDRPYVEHLVAVVAGVRACAGDEDQLKAAWLHDAVEDTPLTERWLRGLELSTRTQDIVLALTKRDGEPAREYADRILATPGALLVKAADIAHNADPARIAGVADEATRTRLTEKYAGMRALLGLDAAAPCWGVARR
ncbi:HD domain-containing protein [Streptomyces sp. MAI_2237]